jgi:hypothetical protein
MFEEKGEQAGGCAKATCHKLLNREVRTAEFAEFELLIFVPLLFLTYFENGGRTAHLKN